MSSELEELKKRLYKKGEEFSERGKKDPFKHLRKEDEDSYDYWKNPENKMKQKKSHLFLNTFLVLIVVFLSLVGFVLYYSFSGGNMVSAKKVNIEVKAPVNVDGGQPVNMNVFINNGNSAILESTELVMEFPSNTFAADGTVLTKQRFPLGEIAAGGASNKPMDIILMGLEGEEKKVLVSLEYRLADSNAIFSADAEYVFRLSKPSIGVSVVLPKDVGSKQEFDTEIDFLSSSSMIANNLSLKVQYPTGFQFISATPKPVKGDNVWDLGDVSPKQEKKIIVRGFIEGQNLEEKAFEASVGVLNPGESLQSYGTSVGSLLVKKSDIDLSVFINGKDIEKNIFNVGDQVRVDARWINNLPYPVRDAEVTMEIKGAAYDEKSASASGGFYRNSDGKFVWNSVSLPKLKLIEPGDSGSAYFSFATKKMSTGAYDGQNFAITIDVKIAGLATTESLGNKDVFDVVSKNIKIASGFQLAAQALYNSGDFTNQGPLPPKVGQETTYTIVWSLGSNINDFGSTVVSAVLPPYIRWVNNVSPSDANIKFDEKEGKVVWTVGDVLAGTGISSPAKQVSFQVALTPSYNQVRNEPVLMEKAQVEARDMFTGEDFTGESQSLNTNLKDDPQFKYGQSAVTE